MRKTAILTLCVFTVSCAQGAKPFRDDHERGWSWYEDPPPFEGDAADEGKGQPQPAAPEKTVWTQKADRYARELKEIQSKAVMTADPQAVREFLIRQKEMMDHMQVFADVWKRTVFTTPELDYSLTAPTDQNAVRIHNDMELQRKEEAIRSMSQSFGLFFFFSSDCPYCVQFSPVIKMFSQKYDWDVLAVSVDGGANPVFPNAVNDAHGIAAKWNIVSDDPEQALGVPALFAVNPQTQEVIPVAYGMISLHEMEDRAYALYTRRLP